MDALFDASAGLPPSFDGYPLLYMLTTFSLLLGNLLAIEWLWRLLWDLLDRRKPLRHPTTGIRLCMAGLLVGTILRSFPDMVLLVAWHDLTPAGRLQLAVVDNWGDTLSFIPFSLAWLSIHLGGAMIVYQLDRQPIPLHLWPTWRQLRRPLKIGMGVLALCFAFTFLRHQ